jgi:Lysylphosphatidylglycerol synthase TM region
MRDAAFGWLALGVALHLANQVARGRGWCATIRLACPGEERCRARDAVAAWVAGAGMGGILSARGGDAVRMLLLRRRLPDEGYPLLAGTLVAEAAGEAALGVAFLLVLLAGGLDWTPGLGAPPAVWIVPAVLVATAAIVLFRSRWSAFRRLASGLARGCSALRRPRAYARAVTPWQLASRLLRAASLACFLLAFGLPATAAAVGLVMIAQSGGRLLPLAPASAAATVAVLAAGFPSATGTHADVGTLAAFVVGTSTLLTVAGVLLAAPIAVWMYGGSVGSAWNALRGHRWSVPTRRSRPAPAVRGALEAGR